MEDHICVRNIDRIHMTFLDRLGLALRILWHDEFAIMGHVHITPTQIEPIERPMFAFGDDIERAVAQARQRVQLDELAGAEVHTNDPDRHH